MKKIEGALERELEHWVWDSLNRAHRALDFEAPWHFASNVRHDQWQDDGSDDKNERLNCYQVCVHIEPRTGNGEPPLLSYSPEHAVVTPVCPDKVLAHFATPPRDVRGVGISGVNQAVLCDEWVNCISLTPNTFDRDGEGYMRHPMYTLPDRCQANCLPRMFTCREMSFNFNWPNYPGTLGQDW